MKSVNKSTVFHFSPITVDKEEETCRQRRAVSGGGAGGEESASLFMQEGHREAASPLLRLFVWRHFSVGCE